MTSDTSSLLVALYIRDGAQTFTMPEKEDLYHWAFLIMPEEVTYTTCALRLNARNYFSGSETVPWYYEEMRVLAKGTPKLLAIVLVGKIVDMERVLEIVRDIPIVQDDPEWNCVSWIKQALEEIWGDDAALEAGDLRADWVALRDQVVEEAAVKAKDYKPAAPI